MAGVHGAVRGAVSADAHGDRPRGLDPLRTLVRRRFPDFPAACEQRYAATVEGSTSPSSPVPLPHSASATTGARASPAPGAYPAVPTAVIPLGATSALTEIWRRRVVTLFLEKGLLNPDLARKILTWQHAGFSIESGTRILDPPTREAPYQYE